jgi:hypothetical protein
MVTNFDQDAINKNIESAVLVEYIRRSTCDAGRGTARSEPPRIFRDWLRLEFLALFTIIFSKRLCWWAVICQSGEIPPKLRTVRRDF